MGIRSPKCYSDNTDTARFCSNCATPLPSSKEIQVTETLETLNEELTRGTTFPGRYEIKLLYRRLCYGNFTIIL